MSEQKTIYIILTDTGSILSRMIRLYTRAELNHCSIAFDDQLGEVYSFGRKYPRNPFIGGFVRENIRGHLFISSHRPTNCAIFRCTLDIQSYNLIREQIHIIEADHEQYSYNIFGLFGVLLNIEVEPEKAFFCSQFISYLFENIGVRIVNKPPSLVTPQDIARSTKLQPLFYGALNQYLKDEPLRHIS
jgi:hypothetical protein